MKPSRFIEEQIIAILKEQEAGMATAEVCRRHGISSATFNVSARPERHRSASRAAFFTGDVHPDSVFPTPQCFRRKFAEKAPIMVR